jgi:hypothetical protein
MKRAILVLLAILTLGLFGEESVVGQTATGVSVSQIDVFAVSFDQVRDVFPANDFTLKVSSQKSETNLYAIVTRFDIGETASQESYNYATITVQFEMEGSASIRIFTWLPDTVDETINTVEAEELVGKFTIAFDKLVKLGAESGFNWRVSENYQELYRRVAAHLTPENRIEWTFKPSKKNSILPGTYSAVTIVEIPKDAKGVVVASGSSEINRTTCWFFGVWCPGEVVRYTSPIRSGFVPPKDGSNQRPTVAATETSPVEAVTPTPPTPTWAPTPTDTPKPIPTNTPTPTSTPDRISGYYSGLLITHIQDNRYYLESDPGTWGWKGCGIYWNGKIFAIGKTTNPNAAGLSYMVYIEHYGNRILFRMIYLTDYEGNLIDIPSPIRVDDHPFEGVLPADDASGYYSIYSGLTITHIQDNRYFLETNPSTWGWKGCGIYWNGKIFGIGKTTNPNAAGLSYMVYIDSNRGVLKLIYLTDYEGNLVNIPSSIRVDTHEGSHGD